jgi:hypothetical protein
MGWERKVKKTKRIKSSIDQPGKTNASKLLRTFRVVAESKQGSFQGKTESIKT